MEQELENVEEVQQTKETKQEEDLSMFETADNPNIIKVNLDKLKEDETLEEKPAEAPIGETNDAEVVEDNEDAEPVQEKEEVQPEVEAQEQLVVEEVTEEEVEEQAEELAEEVEEAIVEAQETGEALPENIQKLIEFMNETGGDIKDYVKLNQNYDEMDNATTLREYYNQTKPHLNAEEVQFLM